MSSLCDLADFIVVRSELYTSQMSCHAISMTMHTAWRLAPVHVTQFQWLSAWQCRSQTGCMLKWFSLSFNEMSTSNSYCQCPSLSHCRYSSDSLITRTGVNIATKRAARRS